MGGSFINTYTSPDTTPRMIPDISETDSIKGVVRPAFMQIVELIMDDNKAIEPIEKSNLPEFRLMDKAKVVNMTEVTALKNAIQLPVVSNSLTPLTAHKITIMINVTVGIVAIPSIFVVIFLPFFMSYTMPFPM